MPRRHPHRARPRLNRHALPASLLGAAALAAALLTAPSPSSAADVPTCLGEEATIVGGPGEKVRGTEGDDVIVAQGPVRALGGDDVVCNSGNFDLDAGDGDDRVLLLGDYYNSSAFGGDGDDHLTGSVGPDILGGGVGDDVLDGGPGADYLAGSTGNDVLDGGDGEDEADGGPSNGPEGPGDRCSAERMRACDQPLEWQLFETCFGHQPTIVANGGVVRGTTGDDVIVTEGGHVLAGAGDDLVCGSGSVHAGPGDDLVLIVWGGRRTPVPGSSTRDQLGAHGGTGDDQISVTPSADGSIRQQKLTGGPGDDVLVGGGRSDDLHGKQGDDWLVGADGWDDLGGGPGADRLVGGPGRDALYGHRGFDRAAGGQGYDSCVGIEHRRSCRVYRG